MNTQEGYFLSRAMMKWFWDAYAPNPANAPRNLRSPLQANGGTSGRFRLLGSRSRETTSCAIEGLAYARKLDAPRRRHRRALRKPHPDYRLLNAISQVPAVRDALRTKLR
jgi:acetyl esterase/lipase